MKDGHLKVNIDLTSSNNEIRDIGTGGSCPRTRSGNKIVSPKSRNGKYYNLSIPIQNLCFDEKL
jgi:hypothetical protein